MAGDHGVITGQDRRENSYEEAQQASEDSYEALQVSGKARAEEERPEGVTPCS